MRSPALAIGYQLWSRNRMGLTLCGGGLFLVAALVRILPASVWDQPWLRAANLGVVALFFYLFSVFTFADLKLREGTNFERYPARMFTLPLGTRSLVFWPLLFGVVAVGAAWLFLAQWVYRPLGQNLPLWIPALGLGVVCSFFQAIAWSPFGTPIVRVLAASLVGPVPVAFLLWARIVWDWDSWAVGLFFAAFLSFAYLSALLGVALDRSGQLVDLGGFRQALDTFQAWLRPTPRGFRSGLLAQVWVSFRTHGAAQPLALAFLLGILILITGLAPESRERMPFAFLTFIGPFWVAAMMGPGLAKSRFWSSEYGLLPRTSALPLSSGQLYLSLGLTAAWSTGLCWLLVCTLGSAWLWGIGQMSPLLELWSWLTPGFSLVGQWVLLLFGLLACWLLCTGWFLSGATVGLIGNLFLVTGWTFIRALAIPAILMEPIWARDLARSCLGQSWASLLLMGLLIWKLALAGAGVLVGRSQKTMTRSWILGAFAFWCLGSLVVGSFLWIAIPAHLRNFSGAWFLLGSGVAFPLAQLIWGGVALHWNRHR